VNTFNESVEKGREERGVENQCLREDQPATYYGAA
jgi:hypothetical protein